MDRPDTRPPLALHWTEDRTGAAVLGDRAALTASDLPAVVDRVVRELDHRVTAARERKGWTG